MRRGQVFIDINSVSPDRKRESAGLIEAGGADYLDMAVMAPVHPQRPCDAGADRRARARPDRARPRALDFEFDVAGDEAGAATAIKMVRSLFVKGLEAITVEALLAARGLGLLRRDPRLAVGELSRPRLAPDRRAYHFERTLRHGTRRAAEMRESAATLDALGLRGALAAEIAGVQARMGALGMTLPEGDLEAAVAQVARARRQGEK